MLWVEPGEDRTGLVATVAPVAPIDKEYTFAVTEELAGRLQLGHRVMVPLGRSARLVAAFCLKVEAGPWCHTLKPVASLVDPVSYLSVRLLELGRWIARHYACPLGKTLNALVPAAVHKQRGYRKVRRVKLVQPLERICADGIRLGPKQRTLLEYLDRQPEAAELAPMLAATGVSRATVRTAVTRGWVNETIERVPEGAPAFDLPPREPGFELNAEQRAACDAVAELIDAGRFHVALLFGVSGSGKTEVYIQSMRKVLAAGRQVMLLVPEIALTTQLLGRLACRFQDLAVIHSGLTDVERSLTWTEIAAGSKRVVIGTRSAVFAPCRELGLIVVDEEQETSFKNLQAPRFHVRDVAIKRGQIEGIPVLMGSATPSLESWTNCDRLPHYRRLELSRRASRQPLPQVHLVDMREEYFVLGRAAVFSRLLDKKLAEALARGEQAILLINRRGFASALFCPNCKQRVECSGCNAAMVYHATLDAIICHHCGRREAAPHRCPVPTCGQELVRFGSGTQRVEDHLRKRFPDKRIARADSDTMRHRSMYQRLIDDFEAGRIDVLVGTQMIAKGLDFPNVSFVGVVGGDAAAAGADFRAGERLFQLITQVAGRAGRNHLPGEVVVQTTSPDAPALQAAIRHDYRAFVAGELESRRRWGYPPFARLARLVLSHPREQQVRDAANALAERLLEAVTALELPETDVLGPHPCLITRVRGQYRYDLRLRCRRAGHLQQVLDHARTHKLLRARVKTVVIDVDPVSLA